MTYILELAKQVQSDESDKSQEIIMLYPNELEKLESLLREKFIAELGKPVGEVVMVKEPEWMKPRESFKWYKTEFPLGTQLYALPRDKDELK